MQTVVGIFSSRAAAENAVTELLDSVLPDHSIIFLTGERAEAQISSVVPTTDAEPDGMGKAVGAVVGGSIGAGAGFADTRGDQGGINLISATLSSLRRT